VTDLYADSNMYLTGNEVAVAEIFDDTTGAMVLYCAITGTTHNECSSTGSATVAAGDNLEVAVSATAQGNEKEWRVRFRY
jgi:hypothetical protein